MGHIMLEHANIKPTLLSGRTVIIGVGGVGGSVLAELKSEHIPPAAMFYVDTSKEALGKSPVAEKLLIGESVTSGLGSGLIAEVGERCALSSMPEILNRVGDAQNVVIIAGLAGGTGAGATKAITAALSTLDDKRILLIAIMPFVFEKKQHVNRAEEALAGYIESGTETLILRNQQLAKIVDKDATFSEIFSLANTAICAAIEEKVG